MTAIHQLSARLQALPGNVRGALWVLLSALVFTGTNSLVKVVGATVDSFEIAFFRGLFGTLILLPFVFWAGWLTVLKTDRMNFHLARGITSSLHVMTIFYALVHLPLADVTGISFSRPLWVILLAVLFLGEKIRWQRWLATAIGFAGVLVMVQPGSTVNPGAVAAVLNALFVAMTVVLIKRLTATEKSLTILFYGSLIPTLVTLPPALVVWKTPTQFELLLLLGIGGGLSVGHACLIHGLKVGEATAIMPFDYTRIIFAGAAGYFFFAEEPSMVTVLGALLIAASALYIARQETRDKGLIGQPPLPG